ERGGHVCPLIDGVSGSRLPSGAAETGIRPERRAIMAETTARGAAPDESERATHLAEIQERGYSILPDVIDAETCGALLDDLERLERDLGIVPATNSFEGRATWRIYNLLAH